jgi:uncharacterized membrane protein
MHKPEGAKHDYQPQKISGTAHVSATTIETAKDSPGRSLAKALTYRILASGAMFVIFFILFRSYTKRTFSESLGDASIISIIDFVTKLAIYYAHERVWTNIKWGKYWRKQYWNSRVWRRRYRRMHAR